MMDLIVNRRVQRWAVRGFSGRRRILVAERELRLRVDGLEVHSLSV